MSKYEFLKNNKDLVQQIVELGINPHDVQHLEMYENYMRLTKEGHKKVYIIAYLSEIYGVNERTLYRVIDRLK